MDSEFGLIGSGWQDYHDQQIQPLLDQYDRQMSDILTNGAHGVIAQLQAEGDAGGAGSGGGGSDAGAGAKTLVSGPNGGQFQQAGVFSSGQGASLPMSYGDDAGFHSAHLDVGSSTVAPPTPAGAAQLGALAFPQTVTLQSAGAPEKSKFVVRGSGDEDDTDKGNEARGIAAAKAANTALTRNSVLGSVFPDFHTAVGAWSDIAQPLQSQFDTELSSKIYLVPGGWQIGAASSNGTRCLGGARGCSTVVVGGDDGKYYSDYIHTHPSEASLDTLDSKVGNAQGVGAYVSLPSGQINGWKPAMGLIGNQDRALNQFMVRSPKN